MVFNGWKYWFIGLYFYISTSFFQKFPIEKNENESYKGKIILFDDFSKSYLDRSKWNVEKTGMHVNGELQAYVDTNKTIYKENGMLVLQPMYVSGLRPAWWLLGYGNWPETGEIDIMENTGEVDWASADLHGSGYSGETPFVNRYYFGHNNDIKQGHI